MKLKPLCFAFPQSNPCSEASAFKLALTSSLAASIMSVVLSVPARSRSGIQARHV